MTPSDLLALLARLGLSQAQAARLTGYHKMTVWKACHGREPVPVPLAAYLRMREIAERALGRKAKALLAELDAMR